MNETKSGFRNQSGTQWAQHVIHCIHEAQTLSVKARQATMILGETAFRKTYEWAKGLKFKPQMIDFLGLALCLTGLFLSTLVFFAGLGILLYQVFYWLKDGFWTEIPLVHAFNMIFDGTTIQGWFNDPGSWLGLHQIFEWCLHNIPLSLVLMMDSLAVIAIFLSIMTLSLSIRLYQFNRPEAK